MIHLPRGGDISLVEHGFRSQRMLAALELARRVMLEAGVPILGAHPLPPPPRPSPPPLALSLSLSRSLTPSILLPLSPFLHPPSLFPPLSPTSCPSPAPPLPLLLAHSHSQRVSLLIYADTPPAFVTPAPCPFPSFCSRAHPDTLQLTIGRP